MSICCTILTCSAVRDPTITGEIKPDVLPTQLIIPYKVPAKLGARSCEFCKLVSVEAPLKPREKVIRVIAHVTLQPVNVCENSNSPGRIWAEIIYFITLYVILF